ncbi:MAG: DinB family protein [Cyclobacteriaceae bacterium]
MKHLLHVILCLLFSGSAMAQDYEPQSQFAKDFLHVWQVSTRNAIEVAEAMPDSLYSFKPAKESKTFGDQIGHIAFTLEFLSDGFAKDNWGEYKDPVTADMSKQEIIDYLKQNIELATQSICDMTEEASTETIKAFAGRELKRYVTILFIQDHLTNHRAKANLYIRMNGINPPEYAFFN